LLCFPPKQKEYMKRVWHAIAEFWRTTDRWLLLFWLFASGISMVFLLGIHHSGMMTSSKLVSQGGAILLGLLAALILANIDYNTLLRLWKLYVPFCLFLVLLTFTSLGIEEGGNKAWLAVRMAGRSISLQPSEFLKISFITTFALHLNKVGEHLNQPLHVLLLCLHGGVHVLLIQLQDSGTAIIFFSIFIVMIFCAGLAWRYIVAAAAVMMAGLPILWFFIMTEGQKMRFLVLINPELDPDTIFQQVRSAAALSTGGLQGTGVFSGSHVSVPKAYNDFIFSFIGESGGFMACIGVIALLIAIAFKILHNSSAAKDNVGRLICVGVFAMLIAQTFINLGMCIGLLPVIGVTLPLFSAGGSSVLSLYCGLGLVLSVYKHSHTGLFSKGDEHK
jgi:rod shape determining protein RodA